MAAKPILKVKCVGFWDNFVLETNLLGRVLGERYDLVQLDKTDPQTPDFVLCSMFGRPYEFCEYNAPRIFYSGENYAPDFNLVDYAVTPYPIVFGDRHCRYSLAVDPFGRGVALAEQARHFTAAEIAARPYFANFIAGHESEYNLRGDFFKLLNEYKRVEAAGTYLNNMPGGKNVAQGAEKQALQRGCKFTLCFESTAQRGFATEKITDAFLSCTVPVYYGDPDIGQIFNTKAFVNVADYASLEEAAAAVRALDQDDAAYLAMLNTPPFVDANIPFAMQDELRAFLFQIAAQAGQTGPGGEALAYRRSRVYSPARYNTLLAAAFAPAPPPQGVKQKIKKLLGR